MRQQQLHVFNTVHDVSETKARMITRIIVYISFDIADDFKFSYSHIGLFATDQLITDAKCAFVQPKTDSIQSI